jgi:hypothetical protein
VCPRTGLDAVEKRKFLTLPGLELRPLGLPARSQSLYQLRYTYCIYCIYTSQLLIDLFALVNMKIYSDNDRNKLDTGQTRPLV